MDRDKVLNLSEMEKGNVIHFLEQLIATRSYSGEERGVVQIIKREMEKLGFDEVFVDKMGNIIGKIGKGDIKILYDSHIDTVEAGDPKLWPHDPFKATLKDGIIYGLGTSDNKSAIATMCYGLKLAKQFIDLNKFTLYVCGTVQEESCDGLAMEYLLKNSIPKPDYVILGECTNLDIYRGHRGRIEIEIETKGKSAHASAPERGKNAVYSMAKVVNYLEKLNDNLTYDEFLGKGSVSVTKFESASNSLNCVPYGAKIYLDRRLTEGEDKTSVLHELSKTGEDIDIKVLEYEQPSYTGLVVKSEKFFPTWTIDENHILTKTGFKAAMFVRNEICKISRWIFSTNGIASCGRLGIPTIGFGPGEERHAHSVEDQVKLDHLIKSVAFYAIFPKMLEESL